MPQTYQQTLKQIESLQLEARKLRQKEISEVTVRIQEAIATYGLKKSDLFVSGAKQNTQRSPRKTKSKISVAPLYGDQQENVWVGRSPRPKWLRAALDSGKTLADFKLCDVLGLAGAYSGSQSPKQEMAQR